MVILHVAAPAEVGGAERVLQGLAIGHRRLGHDVHVLAILSEPPTGHSFFLPLRETGVRTHALVLPSRAYRRERVSVGALCRRLRPDVVHTHGYRPDILDAPVARRLGIPVVSTVHGFTGGGWKMRLYERLHRAALRRLDVVVAVSALLAELLTRGGVAPARVHVVPNAWMEAPSPLKRGAARRKLGLSTNGFRVGWVGRLSPEKGPDVLLEALPHLGDLPYSVSILGEGPQRPALEHRARNLGVAARVRWHGSVPDARRLFSAFDVFVLSSRTEGTPIALFEAMAAEVPIVAAAVGGVPDVISSNEALLVAPGDALGLAEAIHSVYRDPAAARWRAAAARTRLSKKFACAPWLARYEAIYRDLRSRARSRRT